MDKNRQTLRDTYIELKDLHHRCLIDMQLIEKNDRRVFYFKPETILLADPEKQRLYREQLINSLSSYPPNLRELPSVADELNREMIEAVQDQSEPDQIRQFLSDFYERRIHNIQHKKYKMLLRWAHFALTSEYLDRVGHHGTFTFGRLQYEVENALKRYERLRQDDDYDKVRDGEIKRPESKGKTPGISVSMYTEKPRKDPISCIRMDDFEIFLRQQCYENKLFRVAEKFVTRIKWTSVKKKYEIFKEAHIFLKNQHEEKYNTAQKFEFKVRQQFYGSNMKKSDDLIVQMEEILQLHYISNNILNSSQFVVKAPRRITNLIELQLKIIERAQQFKIFGDIELDEGHSFTYQIKIFFTTYFQRQIIKSQFSVYDQTAREVKDPYEDNDQDFNDESQDINEIQRRNLKSLLLIDFQMVDQFNTNTDQSNIFLLKKGKKINEQLPELKKNFADIQVVRLKKAYWLEFDMIKPNISEYSKKQNAVMSYDYQKDLLLYQIQQLLDLNDIATINTLFNDLASLEQKSYASQFQFQEQVTQILKTSLISDQEAKNLLIYFKDAIQHNFNENEHKERGIEGGLMKKMVLSKNSILRVFPSHYLQCYYTLRHMKMRDTKTKLLYVLNFFRSVQKRLTLELREFAGQEVVSQNVQILQPQEATYTGQTSNNVQGNINFEVTRKGDQKIAKVSHPSQRDSEHDDNSSIKNKESSIAKQSTLSQGQGETVSMNINIVDLKKWKYDKQFHNYMLSTCPVIPNFHSKHGEPIEQKGLQHDSNDTSKTHITKKSSSYLTRIDGFHINEETKEIFVIDDYGMYIMYDCALDDMANLDEELLKIGTYYIKKNEDQFDYQEYKYPLVERFVVMEDLLDCEFNFQFEKAKLIMTYLDSFEHICDPLEQQRQIQIIIDLMALRPRLDYRNSLYFEDSYQAEVQCIKTHYCFIKDVIDYLMKNEKKENQVIREYLQMAYKITNQYMNKQWSESNQEDLKKDLKTRQVVQGGMRLNDLQDIQNDNTTPQIQPTGSTGPTGEETGMIGQGKDKQEIEGEKDKFAELLGLKQITMENIMKTQQRSADELVDDLMNQDSNFIKTQEGYPLFFRQLNDSLSNVQFNTYSAKIGILDFYESLTMIPKVYSATQISFQCEIQDEGVGQTSTQKLKPATGLQLIAFNLIFYEKAHTEFKKCISYYEDELIEYKGSNYLENDIIMSSPDKIMFIMKDMIAHLSRTFKKSLSPFLTAKLDLYTIHYFSFPEITKIEFEQERNVKQDIGFTRNFIENQLQNKGSSQARFFPKLREDDRRINVPPMLIIFCNLIELMRIKELLIANLSESQILTDIYETQKDLVNGDGLTSLSNQLNFETFLVPKELVNFVEDGSLTNIDIDLAINEFDQNLRSNLNFMNSDSIKCLVLESGIQEARASLHYQLMQKQLLLMSVRSNCFLMDNYIRAMTELELFQIHRIKVENSIIDYSKCIKPFNGSLNEEYISIQKSKIASALQQESNGQFQKIVPLKSKLRNQIERIFKQQLQTLNNLKDIKQSNKDNAQQEQQININLPNYSILRIMRDYKIQLLHYYCSYICKNIQLEAVRVQLMGISLNLKQVNSVFPRQTELFKLQNSEQQEVMFLNQISVQQSKEFEFSNLFTNMETGSLHSMQTIPSLKTISNLPLISDEQLSELDKGIFNFQDYSVDRDQLKQNKIEDIKLSSLMKHSINNLIVKQQKNRQFIMNSKIGQILEFYSNLQQMVDMQLFFTKMNFHPVEILQLENATENSLPFWEIDDSVEEDQLIKDVDDQKLAEKILYKLILQKKNKQVLQTELEQLSHQIENLLSQIHIDNKTQISRANIYLKYYVSVQHQRLLVGLIYSLEGLYNKSKSQKSICKLIQSFKELTSIDLMAPIFQNGTILQFKSLSPQHRILTDYTKLDFKSFQQTINGLKHEEDLCPPEFILMEQLFMNPILKCHKSNYFGQIQTQRFQTLNTLFIGLDKDDLNILQQSFISVDSTLSEMLDQSKTPNDLTEKSIQKKENCLQDMLKAKMLYLSMMIILSNSTLPTDSKVFQNEFVQKFKQQISWKVELHKEKKLMKSMPNLNNKKTDQSKSLKQAIQMQDMAIQSSISQNKPNQGGTKKQNQQVFSNYLAVKSTIKVCQKEIEYRLIRAATETMRKHISAISKSIEISSKNIDESIQPIQLFASTLFDNVNKNYHLETINRVSSMQLFLTKLRNRGMDVQTLTSGPAIVFTYKDLNECLQNLCQELISYNEKENVSRQRLSSLKINHLSHLVYIKDCKIEGLTRKIGMIYMNIQKIVSSKIYEKGNSLIYELDKVSRELRFYQDHMYLYENELKTQIQDQFRKQIQQKDILIDIKQKQMIDMKNKIKTEMQNHLIDEQKRIKKQIKQTSRRMKDIDNPINRNNEEQHNNQAQNNIQNKNLLDDNKNANSEEVRNEEWVISPEEATSEMMQMQNLIVKQRTFWFLKFQTLKKHYDDKMNVIESKLSSNQALWEQLDEQDKRYKILQQELQFTQKSFSQSERVIEKLKQELKISEQERIRLFQYKQNKQQRLQELEIQAKKIDVAEHVNITKVIDLLNAKDKELTQLKNEEQNFEERLQKIQQQSKKENNKIQKKFNNEIQLKTEIFGKISSLKNEIKLFEQVGNENEQKDGVIGINQSVIKWKNKFKDLFEICEGLTQENTQLIEQIKILQLANNSQTPSKYQIALNSSLQNKQQPYLNPINKTRNDYQSNQQIDQSSKQNIQLTTNLQTQSNIKDSYKHDINQTPFKTFNNDLITDKNEKLNQSQMQQSAKHLISDESLMNNSNFVIPPILTLNKLIGPIINYNQQQHQQIHSNNSVHNMKSKSKDISLQKSNQSLLSRKTGSTSMGKYHSKGNNNKIDQSKSAYILEDINSSKNRSYYNNLVMRNASLGQNQLQSERVSQLQQIQRNNIDQKQDNIKQQETKIVHSIYSSDSKFVLKGQSLKQ